MTKCFFMLMIIAVSFTCKSNDIVEPVPPVEEDPTFAVLYPFWSSSGSTILFFGHIFGVEGYGLYEIDTSGGRAMLVMQDTLAKGWPVLSPDGKKIAYSAAILGRLFCCAHVWVMNVDGTQPRDVTPFFSNWEYVRWSPDSRTIIFDGGIEDSGLVSYQVVSAEVETGELKILTRGTYGNRDASFLADGKRIAYLSGRIRTDYGGKVFIMNRNGTKPLPIDVTLTASADPRPSPARNELLFVYGLGGENDAGVYSLNVDSVNLPAPREAFHYVYRGDYVNFSQWSPNGNNIVYMLGGSRRKDIFLMDREGHDTRRLTTGFDVNLLSYAWSPDSKRLVFNATDKENGATKTFLYDVTSFTIKELIIKRK